MKAAVGLDVLVVLGKNEIRGAIGKLVKAQKLLAWPLWTGLVTVGQVVQPCCRTERELGTCR